MQTPKYKIVHIIWRDANSGPPSGWMDDDEVEEWIKEDFLCETVGFLIHKCKRWVVVALSVSDGAKTDLMKIPTGMVVKMRIVGKSGK